MSETVYYNNRTSRRRFWLIIAGLPMLSGIFLGVALAPDSTVPALIPITGCFIVLITVAIFYSSRKV